MRKGFHTTIGKRKKEEQKGKEKEKEKRKRKRIRGSGSGRRLCVDFLRRKQLSVHIEREKKEDLFERERESEAIQQAFTQKETVNDQSFQLFRSDT